MTNELATIMADFTLFRLPENATVVEAGTAVNLTDDMIICECDRCKRSFMVKKADLPEESTTNSKFICNDCYTQILEDASPVTKNKDINTALGE